MFRVCHDFILTADRLAARIIPSLTVGVRCPYGRCEDLVSRLWA